MAQNKDLNLNTSAPSASTVTNVGRYYANPSGILHVVMPNSTIYPVNTLFTNTSISGQGGGAAGAITGGAVLGSVAFWITGIVNGVKVVIPSYTASF